MADTEDPGPITRERKSKPAAAPASTPAQPAAETHTHEPGQTCSSCTRLRSALRAARKRIRRLTQEKKTLQEELLSAGEMIEDLASDLEKPL